jgi:tetratricopeptide (TPR) repeat protein
VEEAPPAEVGAVAPALEVPEEVAVKAEEASPVAEVAEAAAPVEEVPVAEAEKPVALAEEVSAPVEEAVPPPVAIEEAPAPPAEAAAEAAVVAAPATEVAEAVLEAVAETVPIAEPAPEDALTQARTLRDSGDANGALDRYEELIKGGHLLDKVLADLEEGAAGALALSRTHTLIGDLCMKQERLQKALEAYRRALTMLKA